jgi:hypothetical protein
MKPCANGVNLSHGFWKLCVCSGQLEVILFGRLVSSGSRKIRLLVPLLYASVQLREMQQHHFSQVPSFECSTEALQRGYIAQPHGIAPQIRPANHILYTGNSSRKLSVLHPDAHLQHLRTQHNIRGHLLNLSNLWPPWAVDSASSLTPMWQKHGGLHRACRAIKT